MSSEASPSELTGKYVFGLRYEDYPLLTTDWDESNVEESSIPDRYIKVVAPRPPYGLTLYTVTAAALSSR